MNEFDKNNENNENNMGSTANKQDETYLLPGLFILCVCYLMFIHIIILRHLNEQYV